MLEFAGILLVVVLILVGALMPLRYTSRMHLPKLRRGVGRPDGQERSPGPARPGD